MKILLTEKTEDSFLEAIKDLKGQFERSDAKAGYGLCIYLDPENEAIPINWRQRVGVSKCEWQRLCGKTFHLLKEEALNGDGESMHLVAQFYQIGMPPVTQDLMSFCYWCEKAVTAGYIFAANDLYSLYSDAKSMFFDKAKAARCQEALDRANLRFVD